MLHHSTYTLHTTDDVRRSCINWICLNVSKCRRDNEMKSHRQFNLTPHGWTLLAVWLKVYFVVQGLALISNLRRSQSASSWWCMPLNLRSMRSQCEHYTCLCVRTCLPTRQKLKVMTEVLLYPAGLVRTDILW